jgi:hypothetical protein
MLSLGKIIDRQKVANEYGDENGPFGGTLALKVDAVYVCVGGGLSHRCVTG